MTRATVIATGPLATIQDLGRPGYQHLGVPRSGAADRVAMTLANRLVGNSEDAATIETTLGGLVLRCDTDTLVAVTGADASVSVNGVAVGVNSAVVARAGTNVEVGTPHWGCRNYVAARGGFDVEPSLGSRSTDTLSGTGPAPLAQGDELGVGDADQTWPATLHAPADTRRVGVVELTTFPGPRANRLSEPGELFTGTWEVTPASNRVGVRLRRRDDDTAPTLTHRTDLPEMPSEGVAHGSVQVPPAGEPVIFLADHPVTGGYPVVGVLSATSVSAAAQLVAGTLVRFQPG